MAHTRVRDGTRALARAGDHVHRALAAVFSVTDGELAWMADARGLERPVEAQRLRNYLYATLPRRTGGVRVIERPKQRLKAIQRRILHEILDWIPAHGSAHGFTRGHSVLSHASSPDPASERERPLARTTYAEGDSRRRPLSRKPNLEQRARLVRRGLIGSRSCRQDARRFRSRRLYRRARSTCSAC